MKKKHRTRLRRQKSAGQSATPPLFPGPLIPVTGQPKPADKQYLREVAKVIDSKLPDNTGWIFLASPFGGPGGRVQYTSNIDRSDAIKLLKEFLFNTGNEEDWMQHIR
jgi:hypothetical protein